MPEPTHRTFWRCVRAYPLIEKDFMSRAAIGEIMRPPFTTRRQRLFEGISVYSDLAIAGEQAQRFNPPYRYLAELQIADDGSLPYESSSRVDAHCTLWATPGDLQKRVVPVREVLS
jgi:hypothetical protein